MKTDPNEIYPIACEKVADNFVTKYFSPNKINVDMYCVSDDPTGAWCINDFWLSPQNMYDYMRYNYTTKQMFEHYNYVLELADKKPNENPVNIKNYLKLKNELKQHTKKETYYSTIVNSSIWNEWKKHCEETMEWDLHESIECGLLSDKHWQAFLSWFLKHK